MMKDLFVSFKDNFKEKSRNPFLGLYLIVWLVRNWDLVFTLFNFDNGTKLAAKIEFVKTYYSQNSFLKGILHNILWTFALLILTYLLLVLSRVIVNFVDKQLIPWAYRITDSNSVVLKSSFELLRSERDSLQSRLDVERDSKAKLEERIKQLESRLLQYESEPQNPGFSEYEILINKLEEKKLLDAYLEIAAEINTGVSISDDYKPKDEFVRLGLIKFNGSSYAGAKGYNITEIGEKVLREVRLR
ncbi:MAG: hypothetical protein ACFHU9_05835 [Fluviicola sp.]